MSHLAYATVEEVTGYDPDSDSDSDSDSGSGSDGGAGGIQRVRLRVLHPLKGEAPTTLTLGQGTGRDARGCSTSHDPLYPVLSQAGRELCVCRLRSTFEQWWVVTQPEYQRIAADLRRRISTGEFGPGERLPILPALCEEYGVSEVTVRNARGLLRNEGVVESRARAGTRVRPRPPVHRMAADR
ncbi:winged helix-turn-helix domain-containing protein [Streptomyces tanashiensis]|uniref:Winged helix-turn-helix domain-containing protein n=1 Tax=Streptomyces tanashiensis TaxID=67367 RepID=A0ABY6R0G6_9ACTN|nr:winged helix-turn-helix domain-containing protein [Streptomyces tanashiensis]UZX23417.1 winged helix-turn-helix domain-containing protein [Streptomyces tanashiensis]